jgi:DNA-binding NtrC family response regulator
VTNEDARLQPRLTPELLIAQSASMASVVNIVRKVAPTDLAVLIQGEHGAGKHSVAREIHRLSRRAGGPLVHVACGALRELQLDAELFGQASPDAPGQRRTHPGLIQSARGGTLFLDEVWRLPFWAAAKLLEIIHQRPFSPYDGLESGPLGVRLIAATSRDLEAAVARNEFYSGLYYYVNAIHIHVPPLRDRREDIPALASHFLAVADGTSRGRESPHPGPLPGGEGTSLTGPPTKGEGTSLTGLPAEGDEAALPQYRFTPEAVERLVAYDWPGNAHELAVVVVHAMLLAEAEEIGPECIVDALRSVRERAAYDESADKTPGPAEENAIANENTGHESSAAETLSVPVAGGLKQIERFLVEEVIRRCRGNKAAAARSLGLHRRTLYRLLREKGKEGKKGKEEG